MHLARFALLALLTFTLVSGCGPKNRTAPARVNGTVRYKGETVPGGNITFHSKDKGSYNSSIGRDGSYSVVDVPDGEMVVTVETESINPNRKVRSLGPQADKMYAERMAAEGRSAMEKMPAEAYKKVPTKYGDPKTSTLKATLTAGKQSKDFDLTD